MLALLVLLLFQVSLCSEAPLIRFITIGEASSILVSRNEYAVSGLRGLGYEVGSFRCWDDMALAGDMACIMPVINEILASTAPSRILVVNVWQSSYVSEQIAYLQAVADSGAFVIQTGGSKHSAVNGSYFLTPDNYGVGVDIAQRLCQLLPQGAEVAVYQISPPIGFCVLRTNGLEAGFNQFCPERGFTLKRTDMKRRQLALQREVIATSLLFSPNTRAIFGCDGTMTQITLDLLGLRGVLYTGIATTTAKAVSWTKSGKVVAAVLPGGALGDQLRDLVTAFAKGGLSPSYPSPVLPHSSLLAKSWLFTTTPLADLQAVALVGYESGVAPLQIIDTTTEPPTAAVFVNVSLVVEAIYQVLTEDNSLTCKFTMEVTWWDERIKWAANQWASQVGDEPQFELDSLWKPLYRIDNSMEADPGGLTTQVLTSTNNGRVKLRTTSTSRLLCQYNLTKFPGDQQDCSINVRAMDPWTRLTPVSNALDTGFQMPAFEVLTDVQDSADGLLARMDIKLVRFKMPFVYPVIIPSMMLSYLTFLGFKLGAEVTMERFCLTLTNLLTLVALRGSISSLLPLNAGETWIEWWFMFNVMALVCTNIWHATCYRGTLSCMIFFYEKMGKLDRLDLNGIRGKPTPREKLQPPSLHRLSQASGAGQSVVRRNAGRKVGVDETEGEGVELMPIGAPSGETIRGGSVPTTVPSSNAAPAALWPPPTVDEWQKGFSVAGAMDHIDDEDDAESDLICIAGRKYSRKFTVHVDNWSLSLFSGLYTLGACAMLFALWMY